MRGEPSTKAKLKENKTREGLAYGNSNGIQPEERHSIGSAPKVERKRKFTGVALPWEGVHCVPMVPCYHAVVF